MPVAKGCPLEPHERPNSCRNCPLGFEEKRARCRWFQGMINAFS